MNMLLTCALALLLGALRCQCWRTHAPNQKIVTQVLPQNSQFIQKGQIVQNETSSHVTRDDSATMNCRQLPCFLVTNKALIPLNVLAITSIMGTAVVKNRMSTGGQMSFEAGKPGLWNFEVLIDDGEFYWAKGEESTWYVGAQVAAMGANQIVKAVLSGHTLSYTVGTAVCSAFATVVAAPVAVTAGVIAFAASYTATAMAKTLLYDVTKDCVERIGSPGMKRRRQKLRSVKDVEKEFITMTKSWVPFKDIADEKSVKTNLRVSAHIENYDTLVISRADAVSYLRAVDSTFRISWYVKPELSIGGKHMHGSRSFNLLGGFEMPEPGDIIVKWVGLSMQETDLPEKLRKAQVDSRTK